MMTSSFGVVVVVVVVVEVVVVVVVVIVVVVDEANRRGTHSFILGSEKAMLANELQLVYCLLSPLKLV